MVSDGFEINKIALDIHIKAGHFNEVGKIHVGLLKNHKYVFKTLICLCLKIR